MRRALIAGASRSASGKPTGAATRRRRRRRSAADASTSIIWATAAETPPLARTRRARVRTFRSRRQSPGRCRMGHQTGCVLDHIGEDQNGLGRADHLRADVGRAYEQPRQLLFGTVSREHGRAAQERRRGRPDNITPSPAHLSPAKSRLATVLPS